MKKFLILLFVTTSLFAQSRFDKFVAYLYSLNSDSLRQTKVDSFWNFVKQVGEPYITGDTANFLYKGTASSVSIPGDHNGWDLNASIMTRVQGTKLFYYSKVFEMNARIDYKYVLNGSNWILDPANPNLVWGGFGPNNELAMPDYIQPWEINYKPSIPHGTEKSFSLRSENTGKNYQVTVYLPPNYNENDSLRYPVVYFQDGQEYIQLGSAINVLDNLTDSSKIRPLIAVFVKPTNRNEEYAFSLRDKYAKFFAEELLPYVDLNFKTIQKPSARLLIGDSFGGNISALIAFKYPENFGLIGLQSAAFWPNNYEVYNLFKNSEAKEIKIFSVWGTYESLLKNIHDFQNVLESKGYTFGWKEFPEGHSWGLWRATIDLILHYFFPPTATKANNIKGKNGLGFRLYQNYPNPFGKGFSNNVSTTTIKYSIPMLKDSFKISLKIYDALGREIETVFQGFQKGGTHSVKFDAANLASGIYFYKLTVFSPQSASCLITEQTGKMVLVN